MVEGKPPRTFRAQRKSWYSGIELVEATDDNRPLIVGERTNEVGSRAFKRLITDEKFEEATEIARAQSRAARTSSTSTSKTLTATNWPTSTGFTRRSFTRSKCRS